MNYFDIITNKKLKFENYFIYFDFERLSYDEKFNFLIDNKIILKGDKTEPSFICVYDSVPVYYRKLEFYFDNPMEYKGYNYNVNKDIVDEYYNYLFARIENESIYYDSYYDVNYKVEKKIELTIDKKNKKRILKKHHDKYALKFSNYNVDIDYLNSKEIEQQYTSWKDLITDDFYEELYCYISGKPLNIKESSTINYWITIKECTSAIIYSQKELQKLKRKKITKKVSLDSNFPKIFKDLQNENIFFDFLLKQNIIDNHKILIKQSKLNPICHAFYNVSLENNKLSVFKNNVSKQEFLTFLNQYFKTTNSRFSSVSYYEKSVQDFYNRI